MLLFIGVAFDFNTFHCSMLWVSSEAFLWKWIITRVVKSSLKTTPKIDNKYFLFIFLQFIKIFLSISCLFASTYLRHFFYKLFPIFLFLASTFKSHFSHTSNCLLWYLFLCNYLAGNFFKIFFAVTTRCTRMNSNTSSAN